MDAQLYEQFVALKNLGKKVEAKSALESFIASFDTLEQKRDWVFPFLAKGEYGHKIRHEIYEGLIYGVLVDGYLKGDANSIVWLAKTVSNIYEMKSLHARLENKTALTFFKEAYKLEPTEEVRRHLLDTIISWFRFSQHEWPAGILCEMDGANIGECEEILQEIEFARILDQESKYDNYLFDFEKKVREYILHLRDRILKSQ